MSRQHPAAGAAVALFLLGSAAALAQDGQAAPQPPAMPPATSPATPAAEAAAPAAYQGPSYTSFLRRNADYAAAVREQRWADAERLLDASGDPRAGLARIYLHLERGRLTEAWQAARQHDEADRGEALQAVTRHALERARSAGADAKKRTDAVNLGLAAATLAIQADPGAVDATADKGLLLAELAALTKEPSAAEALRGEAGRFQGRAEELKKAAAAKGGRGEPLRVEGAVTKPVKIAGDPPTPTEVAQRSGVWGEVIVDAVIDEQGNVVDARVVKGLPMGLDQQALVAVRNWKFKPATLEGKPVKVRTDLTVPFEKPKPAAKK